MPTQTWAQSNQTKTVIEVLECAQTKNKLRPRQGKKLTDQVNLQSRDGFVFECFMTLLNRKGMLCFCSLSRGSLKHKCCDKEELGVLRSKSKHVLEGPHDCGKGSDLISVSWKIAFCNQGQRALYKRSVQSQTRS